MELKKIITNEEIMTTFEIGELLDLFSEQGMTIQHFLKAAAVMCDNYKDIAGPDELNDAMALIKMAIEKVDEADEGV